MAIFNSYITNYQRVIVYPPNNHWFMGKMGFQIVGFGGFRWYSNLMGRLPWFHLPSIEKCLHLVAIQNNCPKNWMVCCKYHQFCWFIHIPLSSHTLQTRWVLQGVGFQFPISERSWFSWKKSPKSSRTPHVDSLASGSNLSGSQQMARFEATKEWVKGQFNRFIPTSSEILPRFFRDCGWLIGFATLKYIGTSSWWAGDLTSSNLSWPAIAQNPWPVAFHSQNRWDQWLPPAPMTKYSCDSSPKLTYGNGEKSPWVTWEQAPSSGPSGAIFFMGYGAISLGCHIWACPQKGIADTSFHPLVCHHLTSLNGHINWW